MGTDQVTTQNLRVVSDRRRARPDPRRGLGAGLRRRMGQGSRRGQEAAEGCAGSRQVPHARAAAERSAKTREPDGHEIRHDVDRRSGRGLARTQRRGVRPRAAQGPDRAHGPLAARQAPVRRHKTLGRAEIARTGKKMYKQKGTGGARHGSARVPQFRGGGRAMGPVVRSHEHDLPKKVRALALRHALSAKVAGRRVDRLGKRELAEAKTKRCATPSRRRDSERADHRRRRGRREVRAGRAQPAADRRAAGRRASTSTTSCAAASSC